MVIFIDVTKQKEENAKAYQVLSEIVKEKIKGKKLDVFEYHPKELPIFYFYRDFRDKNFAWKGWRSIFSLDFLHSLFGKIRTYIESHMVGYDIEPLFVDGRPINPKIIVRDKRDKIPDLAKGIAERYEQATGIEMRII